MTGRYYVEPPNIMPGIMALGRGLESRAQKQLEIAKDKKAEDLRQRAVQVIRVGNPELVSNFIAENPEARQVYSDLLGAESAFKLDAAKRWLIDNEDPSQIHMAQAEQAIAEGRDPSGNLEMARATMSVQNREQAKKRHELVLAMLDPNAYKQYIQSKSGSDEMGMDYAGIKEFEYLTDGLSKEEKASAKRIKLGLSPRATEDAVAKGEKAFAAEAGKLGARYNLEPKVAGAVVAAKNEANATAKYYAQERSNETAWNVYNSAMENLSKAMSGTETGPFVGFIPAITKNQQIAEGSVAIMAPVLKQMFRASGEGVFTDRDQELLMKMVPTRKDQPGARIAKIKAIDSVVREKLNIQDDRAQKVAKPDDQTTKRRRFNPATGAFE